MYSAYVQNQWTSFSRGAAMFFVLFCFVFLRQALSRFSAILEMLWFFNTLEWRHNGYDGVSNHQPHNCLLNRLFRCRSRKISKLRVTGLCEGNSPMTGEFPAWRASNAENVSIWWRDHEICISIYICSTAPELCETQLRLILLAEIYVGGVSFSPHNTKKDEAREGEAWRCISQTRTGRCLLVFAKYCSRKPCAYFLGYTVY